eukprot:TRINITY_DN11103_c0_g1_i2.p1 TRINITY_DN11103_c0_g1~~TRINITY_DN11103_c0_g1_i2.p1  ORF type:complete len:215 (+),score=38.75 TRINITY_DN11103_c0_g1_i2:98-742(+)
MLTLKDDDLNILVIVIVLVVWVACMIGVCVCGRTVKDGGQTEGATSAASDESIPEWATEYLPRKLRLTKEQQRSIVAILRKAHVGNKRTRSGNFESNCTICLDSLTEDRSAQESLTSTPRTACSHHDAASTAISISSDLRYNPNAPDVDDDSHDFPTSNWTSFPCGHSFHVLCFETWMLDEFHRGLDPSCPVCRRPVAKMLWPNAAQRPVTVVD